MKRIEVFIAKAAANEDPNFFVSVNGNSFLLPRGKKSMVPAAVAREIERSGRAAEIFYESVDEKKQSAN